MRIFRCITGSIAVLLATSALAKDPPKPPHMVTQAEAKEAALIAYKGTVKSCELEFEGGRWIYSFDIADANGGSSTHEINIDAITGKLVSQQIENAQDEKKEQAQKRKDGK